MEDNRKYTFFEIEKEFYYENYSEFVEGQNQRNREARYADRQKTIEGILENTMTCPEETILQLGNIDATVDASIFARIAAEYFEEFQRRYGSHIHILDWACNNRLSYYEIIATDFDGNSITKKFTSQYSLLSGFHISIDRSSYR